MRKTVNVEEFVQNVKKTVIAVIVEKIVRNAKTTANVEEIVHNVIKTACAIAVCLITSLTSESSSSSVYLFDKINQKKLAKNVYFLPFPACV